MSWNPVEKQNPLQDAAKGPDILTYGSFHTCLQSRIRGPVIMLLCMKPCIELGLIFLLRNRTFLYSVNLL
jgi:hypothetical protein